MIVTIGREFGSGGRELGKRLADYLGVPCYDKEIIIEIAKNQGITPERVKAISETDIRKIYPSTIGRSFYSPIYFSNGLIDVFVEESEVIKRLASQGDCVIVGRSADAVLEDMNTFNIFVYANKESKIKRCLAKGREGDTEKVILKQMKKIDGSRAANHRVISSKEWGKKECYDLCVNTSNVEIKSLIPAIAEYVKAYFYENK